MSQQEVAVRALSREDVITRCNALSNVLIDCVAGGASVSFLAPLSREKALVFWQGVAESVARGERILLVAEDSTTDDLVGTVQIVLAQPENQLHRGDLAKMLVCGRVRRRGIGARLLLAAEAAAHAAGKMLLVLDTVTGSDAERLYLRLGWVRIGIVPNYALMPDGRPAATTYFYKSLV
jgi:GNAT superfamily N-acetyltransferase